MLYTYVAICTSGLMQQTSFINDTNYSYASLPSDTRLLVQDSPDIQVTSTPLVTWMSACNLHDTPVH